MKVTIVVSIGTRYLAKKKIDIPITPTLGLPLGLYVKSREKTFTVKKVAYSEKDGEIFVYVESRNELEEQEICALILEDPSWNKT